MNEEIIQQEFAQVTEMTQAEKENQFNLIRQAITQEVARFGINELELNEAILAFVKSLAWLKTEHMSEGSISYSLKKKKNIRDASTATIEVGATYTDIISDTESSKLTHTFLEKTFKTVREE